MIEIYTDGASKGNPGKGGYGVIIILKQTQQLIKEYSEGFRNTTNNRMELLAVITGLNKIKDFSHLIYLYSDSKYVIDPINKNWISKWEFKNFYGIKNPDLWQILIQLLGKFSITFIWIKGHNGNYFNERVNELAVKASEKKNLKIDLNYEKIYQYQ